MERKVVSGLMLTLLLLGMVTLAFNVQPAKSDWTWTETIYIRADGSIDPDTAPISTVDNITFTLTDNIVGDVPDRSDAIVVDRDNIVVDGAGYTVNGLARAFLSNGIYLSYRYNVTLKNIKVTNFYYGIYLTSSDSNVLSGNTASNNEAGIYLDSSDNNVLSGNTASSNSFYGIYLWVSSDNFIYHNNFVNNAQQVYSYLSTNVWDDGYPSGGNYWSDYAGVDDDGDCIGDTPYVIDSDNIDHYPLMPPSDTTPPTLSILSPESKTYTVNDVPLTFTVSESTSWIGYSLDGQMNVTISGNTTLSALSDGSHSLVVYAKDTAGNTGASEIISFSIEPPPAEPPPAELFPIWIAAVMVIIAAFGTSVYLLKIRKKS